MSERKIYDITEFEYKREIGKRTLYPFFSLNKITGGGEVGALNILFGKTNSGKSELAMQFMVDWVENGEKVCAMLGEHTMKKAQNLLYKKVSYYNKDTWLWVKYDIDGKSTGISELFISEEDENKAKKIFKGNLFLYDTRKGFDLDNILLGFEDGYKNGCSVFLLDNGMMIDMESSNELKEQKDTIEKLRQWAKEKQVIIYLVLHARKIDVNRIRLTEYDINGSSNISNKATTIISIIRTNILSKSLAEYKSYQKLMEANDIDLENTDAVLEVVKEKNGTGFGFVPLKWYDSTKTFREIDRRNFENKKAIQNVEMEELIDEEYDLPF